MLLDEIQKYRIILATKSPRRQHLMKEAGFSFEVSHLHEVEENYPENLNKFEIPIYLAELKSDAYPDKLEEQDLLITADTIVWLNGRVINKPNGREDAISILRSLSGNMHEVITGVCIRNSHEKLCFHSQSEVFFRKLKEEEILYYVDHFKPFDKAGAYGIQEWVGYIGISKIQGSFFNVMGLPIQLLYQKLEEFIDKNIEL